MEYIERIDAIRLTTPYRDWITVGENGITKITNFNGYGFRVYRDGKIYEDINGNFVDIIRYKVIELEKEA